MAKTSEEWLAVVSPPKHRGLLKLFLGYAPGVGKTYSMLSEAIRRASRGEDVVVGVVETHGRKPIVELAGKLETVPPKTIPYRGATFSEMDVDAILARKPQVVVVDELAHTNIPGSKHRKRYEDVLELVEARMEVLSTVNIQHIESIAPTVRTIAGITVRETVPDWVVRSAGETVMVDLTAEALQNRMRRGDIYGTEKADQALKNFFRRGNLIALRELALRQVTEHVDRSLETYVTQEDIRKTWAVRERIAVCISSGPEAQYLIARGARMARRLDATLYVVFVDTGRDSSADSQKTLAANIQLAESLGAEVVRLSGSNIAEECARFTREKRITQAIFGRPALHGLRQWLYVNAMSRFLELAPGVDLHIVTHEQD